MRNRRSTGFGLGEGGFTLVELLIVAVLGSLVVLATYQVLITNQRTYSAQQAQVRGQQTVRAGLDVLFGELREISAPGGDILQMGQDSVQVRTMRKFGLVCGVDAGDTQLTLTREGSWFEEDDSVVFFADNDPTLRGDDVYLNGIVTGVDTLAACGAAEGQELDLNLIDPNGMVDNTVLSGAPVRAYTHYIYGLYTVAGEPYLARRSPGEDPVPLVGPVRSSDGLRFEYLDSSGNPTTTTTDVAQIRVTLRTRSGVRDAQGNLVSDSITARIYPRN